MNRQQGTIKNGQVVLDSPPLFPEGTRVEVLPIQEPNLTSGMSEEQWPTTSAGIEAHLARLDQPRDEWERGLLEAARDWGLSLPDPQP